MQPNNELSLSRFARQVGRPAAREVDMVVIHCSATPSGKPLQQGLPGQPGYLNAPQVIDTWHAARGFKRELDAVRAHNPELPAIGYHYVIDLDGTTWAGRHLDEVGAHAVNFNTRSVGVCLVGGAEPQARYTAAQWRSLRILVQLLLKECGIRYGYAARFPKPSDPKVAVWTGGVIGHRDLSPDLNGDGQILRDEWLKTCPGFEVREWIERGLEPEPQHIQPEQAP